MQSILLVDDEIHIRRDLGSRLRSRGYVVHVAEDLERAEKIVYCEKLDYAIVDLKIDWRAEFGGALIASFVKKSQPRAKVIVLTAYPIDDNVRSMFDVEFDGYIEKGGEENYIEAVLRTLEELRNRPDFRKCFVLMPFSATKSCSEDQWSYIFTGMIKPAVERSGFAFACKRSDVPTGSIIEHILDEVNRADLVIADLTDRNPNVFYELGVRHALRDSTILVAQDINDVPFDLRPYAVVVYDWKTDIGRKDFKKRIKRIIESLDGEPSQGASPVRKYLGIN